jgi:hypothetical protein
MIYDKVDVTHISHSNCEASGGLATFSKARPNGGTISHDVEVCTVSTISTTVIQTNAGTKR